MRKRLVKIASVLTPTPRWFQFSLKTLLLAVVVVSPPLAWLGLKLEAKRRERAAAKQVVRLRGRVTYRSRIERSDTSPHLLRWLKPILGDDLFDSIHDVYISFKHLGADDLAFLDDLRDLQSLELECVSVTDDALVHLRSVRRLRALSLLGSDTRGVAILHIADHPDLRELDLSGTKVTSAELVHLRTLPKLTWLNLTGTRFGDPGMIHLAELPHLDTLFLDDTEVTDGGIEHLGRATALRRLSLRGLDIGRRGLAHLRGLHELETLDVGYTRVNDEGISELTPLANLSSLCVAGTEVSAASLRRLGRLGRLRRVGTWETQVNALEIGALRELLPTCKFITTQPHEESPCLPSLSRIPPFLR